MADREAEEGALDATVTRLRRLRLAVVALAVVWAGTVGWILLRDGSVPDVVSVERLEIVEPDGQPAFVLSNSQRPPVATIDGDALLQGHAEERRKSNFVFFDGHGDEVGGMLFGNEETEDGFSATRHLSLDGYEQDQTVRLFHSQNPEGATSGLSVTDRPEDLSLEESFAALGLELPVDRADARKAMAEIPEEARADSVRELFGVSRVFLGSDGSDRAELILRDGEGRPRVVLAAPEDGEPSLRLLDEDGNIVARLPEG